MSELSDYYDSRYEGSEYDLCENLVEVFKSRYEEAKNSPVGSIIICPTCARAHKKTTYHKVFCNPKKCKDQYWNTVDDKRRERAKMFK